MTSLAGFSDESLRILLRAQEYRAGSFAQRIEMEQQTRRVRAAAAETRRRRGFE